MNVQLPDAPTSYGQDDQSNLRSQIKQAFRQALSAGDDINSKTGRIYLYAPNGSRWQLVVSNAGALSTVAA